MSTIDTASTGQNPAAVIVLAAGKGTRMKSALPKAVFKSLQRTIQGGGKLDAARGRLLVRLEEDRQKVTREELESVLGDREFVSSHPVMQKMNPRIYEMIQDFGAR